MHAEIPPLSELAKSITPGLYRHYRGGEYEVLCVGRLEGDVVKEMVTYKSLEHGDVWVRPVIEFTEYVYSENYTGPRFIKIDD